MNDKEKIIVFLARFLAASTLSVAIGVNYLGFESFYSFLLFLANLSLIVISFFIGLLGGMISLVRKNPYIHSRYYGKLLIFSLLSFFILFFGWGMLVAPYA